MVGWMLINFFGVCVDFMDWVEWGECYFFLLVLINGERV